MTLGIRGVQKLRTLTPSVRIKSELDMYGLKVDHRVGQIKGASKMLPCLPVGTSHRFWCNFSETRRCSCHLLNHSPPERTLIRIEATETCRKSQTAFADLAAKFGDTSLSAAFSEAFAVQTLQFNSTKEMQSSLVYPVLDTQWNKGRGASACIPFITPDPITRYHPQIEKMPQITPKKRSQSSTVVYFDKKSTREPLNYGLHRSFRPKCVATYTGFLNKYAKPKTSSLRKPKAKLHLARTQGDDMSSKLDAW